MSPSKTAAEPAPRPRPAAGRTPRAGVRLLLLWGPCVQRCILELTLGLPWTRRPPTSLDSRTVPQRARFRPVWLQAYWLGGCQEETSPEGQPGGMPSAPRPVTILPPG